MAHKDMRASEGKVEILLQEGVFYNPEMELCRDLSSLCLGALGGKLSVVDAMCASGVRGLRYRRENKNVKSLSLVDMSSKAVALAKRNAALNKVRCRVARADACEFLRKNGFDFVELDPFGSPVPYLHDAARSFWGKKSSYLSVTATDMAVLCGAHSAACVKNYGSLPLDNEFCHENAVRILIGNVVRTFSPFNLAAAPIFTISHRHYVKVVFSLSYGSEPAVEAAKKLGFVSYCPKCCFREAKRVVNRENCPHCSHQLQYAGPLYTGALWREETLKKMLELNVERGYGKARQIEKLLETMLAESGMRAYGYYDLHVLAKKMGGKILRIESALEMLNGAGFPSSRTHFCPTAIRTDAPHEKILEIFSEFGRRKPK